MNSSCPLFILIILISILLGYFIYNNKGTSIGTMPTVTESYDPTIDLPAVGAF